MSQIDDVLRKACNQAINPKLTLPEALGLYRSVAILSRALRTEMADNGLPRGFAPDLIALLIAVLNAICSRALEPAASPATIAHLARAIGQIATASRLAQREQPKPAKPAVPRQPPPVPEPRPAPILSPKPVPVVPVAKQDQAFVDTLMADIHRRTMLDYKRAA